MELKEQVCTLEQAKRLKELGVNKPSIFNWVEQTQASYTDIRFGEVRDLYINDEEWVCYDDYHAYTVAELGEMLPKEFKIPDEGLCHIQSYFSLDPDSIGAYLSINTYPDRISVQTIYGSTEAVARAAMVIYLIENQLIPCPTDK